MAKLTSLIVFAQVREPWRGHASPAQKKETATATRPTLRSIALTALRHHWDTCSHSVIDIINGRWTKWSPVDRTIIDWYVKMNATNPKWPLKEPGQEDGRLTVSLKTLSTKLDAHRSSVRRWLREARIRPVAIGRGRNGAIRYLWSDVEGWLQSLEHVD